MGLELISGCEADVVPERGVLAEPNGGYVGTTNWIGRKAERKHVQKARLCPRFRRMKEEENVPLLKAALAYQELMKYRYHFLLGRKGVAEKLTISFPIESFHHLAGLHKKDIDRTKNKKYALQRILEGKKVIKGDISSEQRIRWKCICSLQRMIETNSLVFRFRKHQLPGSNIVADYVLTDSSMVFFVEDGIPVSIFLARKDQMQNVYRSLKLTTLKIEREEIATGTIDTIYVSPSYKP